VDSMREAIVELIAEFSKGFIHVRDSRRSYQNREIEELAHSVMDYGRMSLAVYSRQVAIVEVDDLAFRFRETPQTITKALCLLERQGQAQRTKVHGLWKLQV